jgi:hypothetical protein
LTSLVEAKSSTPPPNNKVVPNLTNLTNSLSYEKISSKMFGYDGKGRDSRLDNSVLTKIAEIKKIHDFLVSADLKTLGTDLNDYNPVMVSQNKTTREKERKIRKGQRDSLLNPMNVINGIWAGLTGSGQTDAEFEKAEDDTERVHSSKEDERKGRVDTQISLWIGNIKKLHSMTTEIKNIMDKLVTTDFTFDPNQDPNKNPVRFQAENKLYLNCIEIK